MSNEDLVIMFQSGENRDQILETLYLENRNLIAKVANRYKSYESFDDLMQEGFFGLLKAAEEWSPDKGANFATYAFIWIRQAITAHLRECGHIIRLPANARHRAFQYLRAVEAFQKENGREPSIIDLAASLGLSIRDTEQAQADARLLFVRSLQEPTGSEEDSTTLEEIIPDTADEIGDVLDDLEQKELSSLLWSLVDNLEEEQPEVLRRRYEGRETLRECGAALGYTPERVRQIEAKAFRKLRAKKNLDKLRPYIDGRVYSLGLSGTGLSSWRNTFSSSTERAAFKLMGIRD